MMKKILSILIIGLFLQGCETTNTSGGNINITGETNRIAAVPLNYVESANCKYIKSTKHTHAGWASFEDDVRKNKIKIANEALSINATHYVITGSFEDGLLPDLRIKVSSTANIYNCNEKEKIIIAEKEKPKKQEPKIDIDDNEVVAAASGSGFYITSSGYILTNNHVVDDCRKISLTHNGKEFEANIIATDSKNDLAILKSNVRPSKFYKLNENDPKLLDDLIIAGYPLGKRVSSAIKTSKGSVTSLAGYGDNYSNFQTDAALNQGNSGGPIINKTGNVIGVAVANFGKNSGVESFNFGIKASTVKTFISSNDVNFTIGSKTILNNNQLGNLINDATIYLECWMTVADIKRIISEEENRKAFFSKYQ